VNVPESYLKAIKKLTGEGALYPSRSELVRMAVREFLIRELETAESFQQLQQYSPNQMVKKLPSTSDEVPAFYHKIKH